MFLAIALLLLLLAAHCSVPKHRSQASTMAAEPQTTLIAGKAEFSDSDSARSEHGVESSAEEAWAPLVRVALEPGVLAGSAANFVVQSVTATPHAKLDTLSEDFYREDFDPIGWLVVRFAVFACFACCACKGSCAANDAV